MFRRYHREYSVQDWRVVSLVHFANKAFPRELDKRCTYVVSLCACVWCVGACTDLYACVLQPVYIPVIMKAGSPIVVPGQEGKPAGYNHRFWDNACRFDDAILHSCCLDTYIGIDIKGGGEEHVFRGEKRRAPHVPPYNTYGCHIYTDEMYVIIEPFALFVKREERSTELLRINKWK